MTVPATPFDLDAEEQRALRAGRIVTRLETIKTARGKSAGRGFGVVAIARSADEVYRTVTHFEDRTEYIPRLEGIEVLARHGSRVRVKQIANATIATAVTTCWFELHEAERRMSWSLDESAPDNTIAAVEGDYRVAPADGGALLAYRAYVDTGLWIPQPVQAHLQKRAIPELLTAIKRRIEGRPSK